MKEMTLNNEQAAEFMKALLAGDDATVDRLLGLSSEDCCGQCQEGGACASMQKPPFEGYEHLEDVLLDALKQAAIGKGKDRHAKDGVAFEEQPMATINKAIGSIDGYVYQAHKKSLEALRLPNERARAELLGAINYLAGAVIALDTWAKK